MQSGARVGWNALSPPRDKPVRPDKRGARVRKSVGLAEAAVRIAQIAAHTENIERNVPEFPRNDAGSATPIPVTTRTGEEHEVTEEIV